MLSPSAFEPTPDHWQAQVQAPTWPHQANENRVRAHRTGWDLQNTDQDAAKQFYASLFGWSYDDPAVGDAPKGSLAWTMLAGGLTRAMPH